MTRVTLLAAIALSGLPAVTRAQLTLDARAGHFDRRLSDQGAVERQSGLIAGGSVGLATRVVIISLGAAGGKLSAQSPATPDTDYGRLTADAAVVVAPWMRLHAEMAASVFVSEAGAQRWILPRVGLEIRAPFASIPVTAHLTGSASLGASTNAATRTKGGIGIHGGVEAGTGTVAVVLQYQLQRVSFELGSGREEQWGEIAFGVRIRP